MNTQVMVPVVKGKDHKALELLKAQLKAQEAMRK